MSYCPNCHTEILTDDTFCPSCGTRIDTPSAVSDIIIVTTPTIPGYTVQRIIGIVTGLTARTRGMGGRFVAGLQSMVGGEVSAFTTEIERARAEAINRVKTKARSLGANAILGLDLETTDVLQGTVLISATGTAVVVTPM
ncbi:MAG: heavy metal-binding domain-containing protein [Candidatus Bathyarchaeota archaeon]|nr:heavy metal-binding domain-containing protein [Candidatus Bathyarchaeota archaeon]